MESTRPIRALSRGLDALTVLNSRDGATVSEVAREIRLPRTTAYRILQTLCDTGLAFRDSADDRYRLTHLVRSLRRGFKDEAWIREIAKPAIDDFGREILWPVSVATLSGTVMMLRETTDHDTPLVAERFSAGFRVPLLGSAAGQAYLAFCQPTQRDSLLDTLAKSTKEADKPARAPRADVLQMLAEIKSKGYATTTGARYAADEVAVSVPVILADAVVAIVSVRFASSALPFKDGLERLLPGLRDCARKIAASLAERSLRIQAETQHASETAA